MPDSPPTISPLDALATPAPAPATEPSPPPPAPTVEITSAGTICYALEQSGVPLVRDVRIRNLSADPLRDLSFELEFAPALGDPLVVPVPDIPAGGEWRSGVLDYRLPAGRLRDLLEAERASLRWTLRPRGAHTSLAHGEAAVDVLAWNEWPGARGPAGLLATFVTPNHPVVATILRRVRDRLAAAGDPTLDGYQARSRKRVEAQIAALYEVVQSLGITYAGLPASFEKTGQKVRLPDLLLESGIGNCLDVTVLFAACLEQMGLRPLLVLIEGHAFPACWAEEERFPEGIVEDAARLRSLTSLGEVLAWDSSAALARPAVSFSGAMREAQASLAKDGNFRYALDVAVLRGDKLRPMSLRGVGGKLAPAADSQSAPTDGSDTPSPSGQSDEIRKILAEAAKEKPLDLDVKKPAPPKEPAGPGAARFRRWQDKLLDLSLRNKLLNFPLTGRGALPLDVPDPALFEDLLSADRSFDLLSKPKAEGKDERNAKLVDARGDAAAERQRVIDDLRAGSLHTPLTETELWTRSRQLHLADRTALEEGGSATLYAAIGLLRWYESSSSEKPLLAPLLLVPVSLEFDRKRRRATVRKSGDDALFNVTLIEKARREFNVDLSALGAADADESGLDVPALLRAAREAVARVPRWEVVEAAHLGLFTFTKFLMWRDLSENSEELLKSEVVRHVAAAEDVPFPEQPPAVAPERLDAEVAPGKLPLVLDADSTQVAAVASALGGRSFVLQGPPGTGKSQTIANIIAASLGAGKQVLFVSEKMAALMVVHRRLEACGLGDFCLELHSNKSQKKAVLESLGKTLERADRVGEVPWEKRSAELAKLRERLDAYAEALHRKQACGLSFYEMESRSKEFGGAAGVSPAEGSAPRPRWKLSGVEGWSAADLAARKEAVAAFAQRAAEIEPAKGHPWAASGLADWSAAGEEAIVDALDEVARAAKAADAAGRTLAEAIGIPLPGPTSGLEDLGRLVVPIEAGPLPLAAIRAPIDGIAWGSSGDAWPGLSARMRKYGAARRAEIARRGDLDARWTDGILAPDVLPLRARFERWSTAHVIVAFIMLFFARRRLKTLARGGLGSNASIVADLTLAQVEADEAPALAREHKEISAALGASWSGGPEEEGVKKLSLADRADAARKALEQLSAHGGPKDIAPIVAAIGPSGTPERRSTLARLGASLGEACVELHSRETALSTKARFPEKHVLVKWEAADHRDALARSCDALRDARSRLRPWCFYTQEAGRLGKLDLTLIADAHRAGDATADSLSAAFERAVIARLVTHARDASDALRTFDGKERHRDVERFAKADREHLSLAQRHVVATLEARLPVVSGAVAESSEVGILLREVKKKSRHMAVRKLLRALPNLLSRLKPCLLMSPLSVAQYLPADGKRFDLVVFDEASQIGTHDSIGAIARGKQVVIVGDSRQLPPTTFFMRQLDDEAPEDNDVVELESILDEAIAKQVPQQMLGWHYRSRHESLIDFSNKRYYDGRLSIFPAARAGAPDLGVRLTPVPDGVYKSGAGKDARTNRKEAEALVRYLVDALIRWHPGERSFGVVTFNIAQQELVSGLLDDARGKHPEIEPHFTGPEAVFVKNLESVQGDERDEILFSPTYARDENGRLRMAFGPLSNAGGERRLNVAVTRARCQLRVFATLRYDDIDSSRTTSVGTLHLREFLRYAAQGGSDDPKSEAARAFASRFEREIADAIAALGYTTRTQVGCGGYRVDLAIEHPARKGEYLLGVECDGPFYGGAKTARDRDRLRRQVLESLGWRTHRVWSQDWWFDRASEEKRLLTAIEAAKKDDAQREERERAEAAARDAKAKADALARDAEKAAGEAEKLAKVAAEARSGARPESATDASSGDSASSKREKKSATPPADGSQSRRDRKPEAPVPEGSQSKKDTKADAPTSEGAQSKKEKKPDAPAPDGSQSKRGDGKKAAPQTPAAPASPAAVYIEADLAPAGVVDDLLAATATAAIRDRVRAVILAEAPVHEDHLLRRVVACWEGAKLTARPRARVQKELEAVARVERIETRDGFLWPRGADPASWSAFRGATARGDLREGEHVPPEEVAAAAAWVLVRGLSLERADLGKETARVLGYARTGKALQERIEEGIALMESRGLTTVEGTRLVWKGV